MTRGLYSIFRTGNGNLPALEWLTEHLEGGLAELMELVAEEDTVVGKACLVRGWADASPDKGDR